MTTKTNKLNIIAILPESIGGRLTTSSIIDGLRALGHCVEVIDILKNEDTNTSQHYDYILSYDFSAIKFVKKHNLKIKTINYFSDVIEDSHSGADWAEYYVELKNPANFVFYWDKELTKQKVGEIANLFYLPHFVNTNIYKNLNCNAEYDVMFAGRLDTEYRLTSFVKLMKALPQYKFAWYTIKRHYDDAISRLQPLEQELLIKAYQGFIDNEKDMADAINKTKIVINFNQQGISSLNYRTIQTIACEKLIINDYRSEGIEIFGDNYIYYEKFEDLQEKIVFYMNNPEKYDKITQQAANVVKSKLSHSAGVTEMLKNCRVVL